MGTWVDFEFYKEDFLMGDNPAIPEASFPRWEVRAIEIINWRNVDINEIGEPPDYLKKCVCAIAEILYTQSNAPQAGDVISETQINYSYKLKEAKSQESIDDEITDTLKKYLRNTKYHAMFLYRGL